MMSPSERLHCGQQQLLVESAVKTAITEDTIGCSDSRNGLSCGLITGGCYLAVELVVGSTPEDDDSST